MIYKIYAKCCTNPEPIKEIDKEEAHDLIKEDIEIKIFNGDINIEGEDDETVNKQCNDIKDKAIEFFEENGYFECGDFEVVITDNPERPNICGDMAWLFE